MNITDFALLVERFYSADLDLAAASCLFGASGLLSPLTQHQLRTNFTDPEIADFWIETVDSRLPEERPQVAGLVITLRAPLSIRTKWLITRFGAGRATPRMKPPADRREQWLVKGADRDGYILLDIGPGSDDEVYRVPRMILRRFP